MQLKNVKTPKDLKNLSPRELQSLCVQLRERIVGQVADKGGHLAPSLGVVELTLALHIVYDAPSDKIVWDVGHQAYAHKLLTGRYEAFSTIRQHGGLSGFPKRTESEYDAFGVGHASTSISAALGYAVARDILKENHSVVAVIGDGSMTGGMAFEALNNAGATKENMTVVLNDNKMSIAPNVGNLSKYLNAVRTDPTWNKVRDEVMEMTGKLPGMGDKLKQLMAKVQDTAKGVLLPGRLFEDLGLRYFGPVDGHNLSELTEMLRRVKEIPGPCLVHVLTNKGHGWQPSEADSYKWHASVPFDPESGTPKQAPSEMPALTSIFGMAMLELARKNPKLVGITGAMPSGCGLNIVEKELPDQVFDVGIAEQHAVTFAAGLACGGVTPVCAIYSSFLQRAFDQVIHDVALQKLPVVFVLDRAGLVGADGPTHHGSFDISYLRLIPNMVILAPSDQNELRDMLSFAVNYNKGPVAIRYPRANALGPVATGFKEITFGEPRILEKGKDVLLLGVGFMLHELQKTSQKLKAEGYTVSLVDPRFIKPLVPDFYLPLIQSHDFIVTLEDNALMGGYGSAVGEFINQHNLKNKRLLSIGLPDDFVEHGDVNRLYQELAIDGNSVAQKILNELKKGA
jgi:1-deoxy-D-xylulose-5-phosphate synthase